MPVVLEMPVYAGQCLHTAHHAFVVASVRVWADHMSQHVMHL